MKHFNKTSRNAVILASVCILAFGMLKTANAADFPEAGNFSAGSKVWAENCNRCHNMRGPKELRDDQWITTAFHMRIRAGLTGQETRDVITFLQASNTKAVKASSTSVAAFVMSGKSGQEIFNQTCISCHGANGAGMFPSVPDFTSAEGPLSKSDDILISHVTNGFQSPGSVMAMPPKGGNPNLKDADIHAVLEYIRKTFGN